MPSGTPKRPTAAEQVVVVADVVDVPLLEQIFPGGRPPRRQWVAGRLQRFDMAVEEEHVGRAGVPEVRGRVLARGGLEEQVLLEPRLAWPIRPVVDSRAVAETDRPRRRGELREREREWLPVR